MPAMIEPASAADGAAIRDISSRVGNFEPMDLDCIEELWTAYLERGESSGYMFLVCRDNGRVSGYATFGPRPLTYGAYDLYWVAVDPEAQGRGVGHALVARVEAEVRARNGRLLLIETSDIPSYASARRLYESSGYRCEAIIRDFYAPGDSLLVYTKRLATG